MKKDCMTDSFDFSVDLICSTLAGGGRHLGRCEIFDELSSTNQYLLSTPFLARDLPWVCIARRQTQGRGRLGRQWQSSSPRNLYMSVACLLNQSSQVTGGLSLLMGVAVVRVLNKYKIKAALKWPNDVLVDGKKIAGILLETKVRPEHQLLLVIGVGVNVDMAGFGDEINQPWVDMCSLLSGNVSLQPSVLAGELLLEIFNMLARYEKKGLGPFIYEWQSLDLCYRQQLQIYDGDKSLSGVGQGIDMQGRLCVEIDGERRFFHGADVSVRVNHVAD